MPTVKPCFRLCNSAMDFTDQYKYLGHIFAHDLRDDADISRQTRLLYARANMLLRKFSAAHTTTKIMLFNAFCSPVYKCQLWFNFIKEPFRRIHVAFNNALRLLLKMPTWCSASQLFVQHGAITFLAAVRKQQFSLLRSLCSCNNDITQAFVSCDRFWRSPILAKWRNDLYV